MPLSDTIKTLIRDAWDDGYPCLLAMSGPQGPNITPKGSMIVFDDVHLAWWGLSGFEEVEITPLSIVCSLKPVRNLQPEAKAARARSGPFVSCDTRRREFSANSA
jgi:hypothetical protein